MICKILKKYFKNVIAFLNESPQPSPFLLMDSLFCFHSLKSCPIPTCQLANLHKKRSKNVWPFHIKVEIKQREYITKAFYLVHALLITEVSINNNYNISNQHVNCHPNVHENFRIYCTIVGVRLSSSCIVRSL